ncbi:uncharacterized protein MELLADRAFT_105388 [Melampsora larici-populina 98AG31]|uniref:Secreted protein n=1 Tax=Melampsora larici-populina (strain 98AG31 / pathotype 3-4-7) TaxID=747676 RepID=F4RHZ2_MELLP|nr:uncharacterized protein MELLADRAFT_105388 [Melampsora larici-populina 98AG31]EGG07907.1 hypothetical protein MELLADRAFT_105388 [Melampsora larici-populina 98AG31]
MLQLNRIIFSLLVSSFVFDQTFSAPTNYLEHQTKQLLTRDPSKGYGFAIDETEGTQEPQEPGLNRRNVDELSVPATLETADGKTTSATESAVEHTVDDVPEMKGDDHLAGNTENQMQKRDTQDVSEAETDMKTEKDEVEE